MATILNFECIEISAENRAAAVEKAPMFIQGDASQAYKKFLDGFDGPVSEAQRKQWMLDYLEKKTHNAPGVGFMVTLIPSAPDTRERPWTVTDVKNDEGRRSFGKCFELRGDDGIVLDRLVNATKKQALARSKELVANGYHGHIDGVITKQVVEGQPIAFSVDYTPSKGAHDGTWMVFGIRAI